MWVSDNPDKYSVQFVDEARDRLNAARLKMRRVKDMNQIDFTEGAPNRRNFSGFVGKSPVSFLVNSEYENLIQSIDSDLHLMAWYLCPVGKES